MATAFSTASHLACNLCGGTHPLEALMEGCPSCGGQLEVSYKLDELRKGAWVDESRAGIWRFHRLLPIRDSSAPYSLGEGRTPLIRVSADLNGGPAVHLKVEGQNPTGSFKDRLNAVAVSAARQFGHSRLSCASTGNHGVSLAAYGARAGFKAAVLCDRKIPALALEELDEYGAKSLVLDSAVNSAGVLAQLWRRGAWFPSIRNFPRPPHRAVGNPYGIEGYKTIAFELLADFGGVGPDAVFVPTGGGDSIAGIWKGFCDLRAIGEIDKLPKLYACQSWAGDSIVRAIEAGRESVDAVDTGESQAVSIIDSRSGDHGLRAVRESGGAAIRISEAELLRAFELGGRNGILMDPASAASIAGCQQYVSRLPRTDRVVCLITGGGQRWTNSTKSRSAGQRGRVWTSAETILDSLLGDDAAD